MNDEQQIHDILIDRDIDAFVARDWPAAAADFDDRAFAGYSAATGELRMTFPTLDAYGTAWMAQAQEHACVDPGTLSAQLAAAQRLDRIEIAHGRALATKVFDGEIPGPQGPVRLAWTTHYFLRFEPGRSRWFVTGFVGYIPGGAVA